jgi:phosphatidylserine decarboxylase
VRIPLAKYGARELVLFGGLALAGLIVSAVLAWWPLALLFAATLVFIVAFFRDPERRVPADPGALVAPADGRVTEVTEAEEPRFLKGRAHKIGIFMSLASVHVNRAPCAGRVEAVDHQPGLFLDARDPASSAQNEAAALAIAEVEGRGTRVLVRQVAGVLARRIICDAAVGDVLSRGQRIGMIKFGSRVEVYVPVEGGFEVLVLPGARVRAGETVLGRFR